MALTKSAVTVGSILSAAEGLFVGHAYADVSMRDIAEAAEVTTGALYHHFPSKEKLYYAMLTAYFSRVRAASLEAIPAGGTCREKLRRLTRVYLALPLEQRGLMALVRRDNHVFRGRTREGIVRAYQASVPDPGGRRGARRHPAWQVAAARPALAGGLCGYRRDHPGRLRAAPVGQRG